MHLDDDSFRAYLNQLDRYPPIDREIELQLARRWVRHREPDVGWRLVCANLRFVVKVASAYRRYGLRMADLIGEGNLGLLEAVQRFEPERGHRFVTYAAFWIRARILAHVLKQRTVVGVGTGPLQSKLFFGLTRERARLSSLFHDEAEIDRRLAASFGTTVARVQHMTGRLSGGDVSLDAPVGDDGAMRGLDLLADERADAEERCALAERRLLLGRRIEAAMARFSPRERYIVEHRMMSEERKTLAQVGRQLGLSRERVRQLEDRLKRKLQRQLADLVEDGEADRRAA